MFDIPRDVNEEIDSAYQFEQIRSTCLSFKSAFFKFDSRPIIVPKQESKKVLV